MSRPPPPPPIRRSNDSAPEVGRIASMYRRLITLEVTDGPTKGMRFATNQRMATIGRATSCAFVVPRDNIISKEHGLFALEADNDTITFTDTSLDSGKTMHTKKQVGSPSTLVPQQSIIILQAGDILRVGVTSLRLMDDFAALESTPNPASDSGGVGIGGGATTASTRGSIGAATSRSDRASVSSVGSGSPIVSTSASGTKSRSGSVSSTGGRAGGVDVFSSLHSRATESTSRKQSLSASDVSSSGALTSQTKDQFNELEALLSSISEATTMDISAIPTSLPPSSRLPLFSSVGGSRLSAGKSAAALSSSSSSTTASRISASSGSPAQNSSTTSSAAAYHPHAHPSSTSSATSSSSSASDAARTAPIYMLAVSPSSVDELSPSFAGPLSPSFSHSNSFSSFSGAAFLSATAAADVMGVSEGGAPKRRSFTQLAIARSRERRNSTPPIDIGGGGGGPPQVLSPSKLGSSKLFSAAASSTATSSAAVAVVSTAATMSISSSPSSKATPRGPRIISMPAPMPR